MTDAPRPVSYIPSIDGLRAVSIAIVFFAHVGLSPLIPGGFGVTVFFFLSGYLITTLLVREQDTFGWISIRTFYLRRVVRLGAPLLITLALGSGLVLAGLAAGDLDASTLASQIFFYYNYFRIHAEAGNTVDGLGILWSLSVEEQFYLVWPFFFILLVRTRIGLGSVVALLVAVLIWRYVRFHTFDADAWAIYTSTDTRIDSILYGCLLALMNGRALAERWFPDRLMVPLLAVSVVLLLATFLLRDPAFRSTLRYSVQGLALMPVFHFAVTRPTLIIFRPLNWKLVRRIGQYSYTLYLVHFIIIKALILNGLDPGQKTLFITVALVLSVGFSALVFEYVEKPLKPLRARLTGH